MDTILSTPIPTLPREPFAAAWTRANQWRGRCLEAFARAETAVTTTLAAMSEVAGRGAGVRLPHLVGQRYEALAEAVAAGAPFAPEAGGLSAALEGFREHHRLRTMLCHGASQVTLDARGRWTILMRTASFRSGRVVRDVLALDEDEAERLRHEVSRTSQALCSRLDHLRSALAAR